MKYDDFQFLTARKSSGVLFVEINNPPVNLLDAKLTRELNSLVKTLEKDDSVSAVLFASADPDFFLCHSDETELLALLGTDFPSPTEIGPFHRIMERLRALPQITIAKIDGIARGGGLEFLLALDMRFASIERGRFCFPEVAVGLIPGGGGTQRLPRLVGPARALQMLVGCEDLDAQKAERWGLINDAIPGAQLDNYVERFATRIAAFPSSALRAAKEALTAATPSLTQGLLKEEQLFISLLRDQHTRARVEAFYRLGSQDRVQQLEQFDEMIQSLFK